MGTPRVMIFDLLRILAICLILICHIGTPILSPLLNYQWDAWIGNIFYLNLGSIGVILFIVISGAVLELNKPKITDATSYLKFQGKRLLRLYPAYWMSLLFAIMLYLYAGKKDFGNLLLQFSGFSAFVNQWGGNLNSVSWCIGLLVVLYLLYPFISCAINSKPYTAIACLLIISISSIFFLNTWAMATNIPLGYLISRWFPLCNLIWFGLGIFIVNKSWYPKTADTTGITLYLGELSFYVFLFHCPILVIAQTSIPVFLAYTLGLAMIAMMVDNRIHDFLKKLPVVLPLRSD